MSAVALWSISKRYHLALVARWGKGSFETSSSIFRRSIQRVGVPLGFSEGFALAEGFSLGLPLGFSEGFALAFPVLPAVVGFLVTVKFGVGTLGDGDYTTITKFPRCHVRSSRFMTITKFITCFLFFLSIPSTITYLKCLWHAHRHRHHAADGDD